MRNVGDVKLREERMRTLLDSIEARHLWRRMNAAKSSITWTPTPSIQQVEQEFERLKERLSKEFNLPGEGAEIAELIYAVSSMMFSVSEGFNVTSRSLIVRAASSLVFAATAATHVYAQDVTKRFPADAAALANVAEENPTSELIVFFRDGVDAAELAGEHDLTVRQQLASDSSAFVLSATSAAAAQTSYAALSGDGRVRSAGFNYRTGYERMGFVPDDPYFHRDTPTVGQPGQWHLVNEHIPGRDVHVRGAWSRNLTGAGVTLAIVDDSLQIAHPDMRRTTRPPTVSILASATSTPARSSEPTITARPSAASPRPAAGTASASPVRAPHARLAGLRIDFENQTTAMFVDATRYHSSGNNTTIKIKNHSYGYSAPFIRSAPEEQRWRIRRPPGPFTSSPPATAASVSRPTATSSTCRTAPMRSPSPP